MDLSLVFFAIFNRVSECKRLRRSVCMVSTYMGIHKISVLFHENLPGRPVAVSNDVESLLVGLLRECDYDIERAEHGIVFPGSGLWSAPATLAVGDEICQDDLCAVVLPVLYVCGYQARRVGLPESGENDRAKAQEPAQANLQGLAVCDAEARHPWREVLV